MPEEAAEKTEQPTPRRRQEAREEGRIPRSADLTAAAALLAGLLLLNWMGPRMLDSMLGLTRELGTAQDVSVLALNRWTVRAGRAAMEMALPFLALLMVMAVVATLAQSGLVFTSKKLMPQLERISPLAGAKRVFSTDSVTRLALGLLKIALIGAVAYWTIMGQINPLLASGAIPAGGVLHMAGRLTFTLALRLSLILLVLGLADYFYQRWKVEKSLRMTKQEVREELRRMEGDPLLKQRRRQIQARLAMQRIGIDVPKADVVVTNPTEYAVALQYDEETMAAPRVIAKGKDLLAARIRQVAQQHGIPVVQRPPLARALFAAVEVGQEVPAAHYRAIAEVLAYVYQLAGKAAR